MDLGLLPQGQSLIEGGRHSMSRTEFTPDSNHMDLAAGSFLRYADSKNISNVKLNLTDMIPDGLKATMVGGGGDGDYLLAVYEE